MSVLCRKRCRLLPPGWTLTRRRLSSSLAVTLRESATDSIKPSFSPWRSCSAQSSAPTRLVFLRVRLVCIVENSLHSPTCPPQEPVLTLRSLWASGYQVVLSYDSQTAVRHQELWPAIPYWWANQRTAQGVISYLDWNKDLGRPGELHLHSGTRLFWLSGVFR